jgi:hypothetical protein
VRQTTAHSLHKLVQNWAPMFNTLKLVKGVQVLVGIGSHEILFPREYTCQPTVEVVVDGRGLGHKISNLLHSGKHKTVHFSCL